MSEGHNSKQSIPIYQQWRGVYKKRIISQPYYISQRSSLLHSNVEKLVGEEDIGTGQQFCRAPQYVSLFSNGRKLFNTA